MSLDALARDSGTFLMVAMDQRESLRTMLAEVHGEPVQRERIARFKLAVAPELGPYASGLLIESEYAAQAAAMLPPGCGLLVAADALVQERGGPVEDTDLDPAVDTAGAVALKLLVTWRDDPHRTRRLELARRFVELAESAGLLSVLEGIVRVADPADRDAAIVEAARELASAGPSLYKVEVPTHGRGEPAEITERCAEIDGAVAMPWVVLSNGVELEDFPAAVEAACRGGASGMLAGRAI
jgi:sulfofructosephosphate aldolase